MGQGKAQDRLFSKRLRTRSIVSEEREGGIILVIMQLAMVRFWSARSSANSVGREPLLRGRETRLMEMTWPLASHTTLEYEQ